MQNIEFIEHLAPKLPTGGLQTAIDMVVMNILAESDFAKYGNDEDDVYYKYSVLLRGAGLRPEVFADELKFSVSAASDIAVTAN
jgi:hypothetical protein